MLLLQTRSQAQQQLLELQSAASKASQALGAEMEAQLEATRREVEGTVALLAERGSQVRAGIRTNGRPGHSMEHGQASRKSGHWSAVPNVSGWVGAWVGRWDGGDSGMSSRRSGVFGALRCVTHLTSPRVPLSCTACHVRQPTARGPCVLMLPS